MQIIPFILATLLGIASMIPGVGGRLSDTDWISASEKGNRTPPNAYPWDGCYPERCPPDE